MPPNSLSLPRRNRSSVSEEPKVMTWGGAALPIALSALCDVLRAFFHFLWFFGPAMAALYCANQVGDLWLIGGVATKLCAVGAAALGVAGIEITGPLGEVVADSIGFIGFLALGLWVLIFNERLLKTAATAPLWFVAAFGIGEIPFLGALPVMTIAVVRLYRAQIQVERTAHQAWEAENAAELERVRQEKLAQVRQMQALQAAQAQEAANDEAFEEAEAANDEQFDEIPARIPRAA